MARGGQPLFTETEIDKALAHGFTRTGPGVSIPTTKRADPARVLETGSGPSHSDLGFPQEPYVQVLRTDIERTFPIDEILDAGPNGKLPGHLVGQFDTVIINNPKEYVPNLTELGRALRPGGRIIIQGNTINPEFEKAIKTANTPPGFKREVDFSAARDLPPEARASAEAVAPNILGGEFSYTTGRGRTTGETQPRPNRRIIYTKPLK
jgi:hypothetical protein